MKFDIVHVYFYLGRGNVFLIMTCSRVETYFVFQDNVAEHTRYGIHHNAQLSGRSSNVCILRHM